MPRGLETTWVSFLGATLLGGPGNQKEKTLDMRHPAALNDQPIWAGQNLTLGTVGNFQKGNRMEIKIITGPPNNHSNFRKRLGDKFPGHLVLNCQLEAPHLVERKDRFARGPCSPSSCDGGLSSQSVRPFCLTFDTQVRQWHLASRKAACRLEDSSSRAGWFCLGKRNPEKYPEL